VTLYLEQDGRLIPFEVDRPGGAATSPLAQMAALTGGALTFSAIVALGSGWDAAVRHNLRAGLDVGWDAFYLWSRISLGVAYVAPPLLKLAHRVLDARDNKEQIVAKVADLPTPRPGRGDTAPPEGLHDKMQRAFRRARSRTRTPKRTMQQSVAQPRVKVVEDWRPQFCLVTAAMLHRPITRAAFDETWRTDGQGLYYRYVGDSAGPHTMRHGMWRHAGFIEQVDKRGKCEWVEGLTWADILSTHRPLKSWALSHGYSPAQVG